MKTKLSLYITAGLAAAISSPVFALEAPADDAPPPPLVAEKQVALPEIKLPAAPPKAQVESAFLGVVSSEVPDMLADHLALKSGEGVIVRSLVPDGPAAQSGIAVHDVITKVAGQPVGSPLEISKQVSGHQPGESISIDLIHQGKPSTLEVTLGTRPTEIADNAPHTLNQLDLENLPKELADRVRDAIAGTSADSTSAAILAKRHPKSRKRCAICRNACKEPSAKPGFLCRAAAWARSKSRAVASFGKWTRKAAWK